MVFFGLLLLLLFIWSFLGKDQKPNEKFLLRNNLTLINTDSLEAIKANVDTLNIKGMDGDFINLDEELGGMDGETIIYSVQIGAFTNFKAKLFLMI